MAPKNKTNCKSIQTSAMSKTNSSESKAPKVSNSIENHFKRAHTQQINPRTNMMEQNRTIILAPSNAGKNNLVYEYIKRSPNIYHQLHVIARNPDQPCYDMLQDKLGGHITIHDPDNVPRVDDECFDDPSIKKLVIIDDYSNDTKLQKDVFSHYFTRGRHKGLTTIYLCHAYHKGAEKMIRLNSDYLLILKTNSKQDLKMILKDFLLNDMDDDKLLNHYEQCTQKKGDFMMVDKLHGKVRYNFLEDLN